LVNKFKIWTELATLTGLLGGFLKFLHCMTFDVLALAETLVLLLWVVTPCGLVDRYQHFALKMEMFLQNAGICLKSKQHYNPEDQH
jgi:hypothetical protein